MEVLPPPAGPRILTLFDTSTGRVLDRQESQAPSLIAQWRADGRAFAVRETHPGGIDELTILVGPAARPAPRTARRGRVQWNASGAIPIAHSCKEFLP